MLLNITLHTWIFNKKEMKTMKNKKIDLFADGKYICSTTQARRCKDAVESLIAFRYSDNTPEYRKAVDVAGKRVSLDGVKKITANFA
jgi:hypothetical protein